VTAGPARGAHRSAPASQRRKDEARREKRTRWRISYEHAATYYCYYCIGHPRFLFSFPAQLESNYLSVRTKEGGSGIISVRAGNPAPRPTDSLLLSAAAAMRPNFSSERWPSTIAATASLCNRHSLRTVDGLEKIIKKGKKLKAVLLLIAPVVHSAPIPACIIHQSQ
jgi:hypothetical protein